MSNIYIVGDIHGCCKTFRRLVLKKINLKKTDTLYCLGDYIDRGPDSKGVIDFILKMRKTGYQVRALRGNHEQMLLDSQRDSQTFELWLDNGGVQTLKSFKINSVNEMEARYLEFFNQTEYIVYSKNFILVHAGLNFKVDKPLEDKKAMLWIRNFQINRKFLRKRILIHGHTPVKKDFILSQEIDGVINLDGGCVYKGYEGLGNLFALNFTTGGFIMMKNID